MNRTILVSMVTIGLIAGTVGLSTTAYFNDTETSANNKFVAGELDLKIDWEESYNGKHVETQELTNNPGSIFNFKDLKPGDHGEATVSLHLDDNPGWIWMNLNQTSNWDNSCTEPEHKAEKGNCGSEGELDEELEFVIWSDDGDNIRQKDENIIFKGTAEELEEKSTSEGVLLDGKPSTDEKEAFEGGETSYIGIKWKLPVETGNRIQGDSVKYDVSFYTEQERHNDNPENPWSEPDNDPVASFERANDRPLETKANKEIRLYSTSTDDEGIEKLKWELGDGTVKFGQDVRHKWTSPGNYTVKLTVTDTDGNTDSTTRVITVCEGDKEQEPGEDPDNSNETAEYTLTQGDTMIELRPLEGDQDPESLYDFRIPERFTGDNGATDPGSGPYYQSVGTEDLQAPETSIMFLYEGPEGLSLVVVHDKGGGDGGSATWTLNDLSSGEWVVKDDLYLDSDTGEPASSNYDRWNISDNPQTIDWTWGSGGTDGGVYSFTDDNLDFTIDPAFNQEAALWEQYYSGTIDDWQVLSGDRSDPNRTSLDLSEPVTIQSN